MQQITDNELATYSHLREFEADVDRVDLAVVDPRVLPVHSTVGLAAQRTLDVIVAGVVFVLALLPCLAIAALVKLTSRGPALYKQERVGWHGERFEVYKFRTMRDGTHAEVLADDTDRQVYEANNFKLPPDDPRITKLGRVLRKTSLDELPQIVNVLRGEMSIVGIRPVERAQLEQRPALDQAYYRSMRPGITGLWQVEGRSTVGTVDRLQLDRQYVEHWSVWNDVVIIARTPGALVRIHHAH